MDPPCFNSAPYPSITNTQYQHFTCHISATFPWRKASTKITLVASQRCSNSSFTGSNKIRMISDRWRNCRALSLMFKKNIESNLLGRSSRASGFNFKPTILCEQRSSASNASNILKSVQTVDPVTICNGTHLHSTETTLAPGSIEHYRWKEPDVSSNEIVLNGTLCKEAKRGHELYSDESQYQDMLSASSQNALQPAGDKGHKGLGIVDFLKGKNVLITGATGFLAKVLVEKILRVQPDVGQLYLLIKAHNFECAQMRLKNEIINVEVFKKLRNHYGNSYEMFMRKKLIPVVGDITQENLGLESSMLKELHEKLHIIVNSAANTTFDERYDVALNTNTKGAERVLELGKLCSNLQLFLHVSTAFVNGERKGRVVEAPFQMGQSVAREMLGRDAVPDVIVEAELKLIENLRDEACQAVENQTANSYPQDMDAFSKQTGKSKKEVIQLLKNVGSQRAKLFGWQDTYVFSKAMGEMIINKLYGQTPVVILRPSVIESSLNEPFAGWMEGNRMMDPIVIAYGKGQLSGFVGDPNCVLDVVPVDMVANVALAAIAKHACKPGLKVYQVASSVVNPLVLDELAKILHKHFSSLPYVDKQGKPVRPEQITFFENREGLMSSFCEAYQLCKSNPCEGGGKLSKRESSMVLKLIEQANYLAGIYKPYTFYAGRFDNTNTEKLYSELSAEEREMFRFNVREIEWDNYINHIHVPGLRRYVMKEGGITTENY